MSDAPPPIPNPPVRPGARRAPDFESFDFAALEQRALAICGIDPASLAGDRTAVMAALYGCNQQIIIIDEGHLVSDIIDRGQHTITGSLTAYFEDEKLLEALRGLSEAKPEQAAEIKPDNRKQRRIDEAKARQKRPRGQRRRMIFDIETDAYDPNRTKDWK